ncbi:MAG: FecR domain-containing protein [Desertifilum sp. SIO1I2]|nr:FecR domain-containing protein [Desertifilum sp. SIO1I2]
MTKFPSYPSACQLAQLSLSVAALTAPCMVTPASVMASPFEQMPIAQAQVEDSVTVAHQWMQSMALPERFGPEPPASSQNIELAQVPIARGLTVEELRGTVTINGRVAQVGDRLSAIGDTITTGPGSTARLRFDSNIGVAELAENTTVRVEVLTGGTAPISELFVTEGRVRLSISRFVSQGFLRSAGEENQSWEIASLDPQIAFADELAQASQQTASATTSPLRVRTPAGVAGVRGTSFGVNVGPTGKTGVSTLDGAVGANAEDFEVLVNPGFSSTISPGQPPTEAIETPRLSTLRVINATRVGVNSVRLSGQVDPMDTVFVNNRPVPTNPDGSFNSYVEPVGGRLRVVVRGPAVRERHYTIITR